MTKNDLFDLVQRVAAHWPHSAGHLTNDTTIAVWWNTLHDVGRDEALAAVESLCREGRDHAPSDGLVLKRATELGFDLPPWPEVVAELRKVLSFGTNVYVGKGEFRDLRQDRLAASPEAVREFVGHVGWPAVEQFDPLDTSSEAQLRTKWERFSRRAVEDRTLVGLPSGGLRRLERVNAAPRAFGELVEGK